MNELKDLGYVNGWRETPEIVNKCWELGHKREQETIGRCLTLTVCRECGYSYKTDSSD